MTDRTKQTGLFDEMNKKIKRAKALLRNAKRLQEELILSEAPGNDGGVNLKLNSSILIENCMTESDLEIVFTQYKEFINMVCERFRNEARCTFNDIGKDEI